MNISTYNITYIISNLFTVYIVKLFMDKYLGVIPERKTKSYIAYSAFFIITTSFYFLFDIPFLMMITNIICFIGISIFYKGDYKRRCVASLYIYIILLIVEILVTALTFTPYMSIFDKYGYSNVLGLFIDKILQFFVVLVLLSINAKKKSTYDTALPFKMSLPSFLIPLSTIIVEMIVVSTPNISQIKVVLSVITLFMINFISFVLYNSILEAYQDKLRNAILDQERDYYHKQCLLMQKAVDDSNAFRHDFNNHMTMINELISKNETSTVTKYIGELIEDSQKHRNIYSSTGNIPIDSVINYKLNSITDGDVDIIVDVSVPTELSVEIMDISTILTNIIDNAIYALEKISKNKRISIKIKYSKGMLVICVSNTYDGIVLYENGVIVSTKKNKSEHGKGLENIRRTAEKYNGLLKLSHNENVFTSEVLLYLP